MLRLLQEEASPSVCEQNQVQSLPSSRQILDNLMEAVNSALNAFWKTAFFFFPLQGNAYYGNVYVFFKALCIWMLMDFREW